MNRFTAIVISLVFLFSVAVVGCGPKKEASSLDAIKVAEAMKTVKEKTDYLLAQAQAFYNSKDFQNAIDAAQYVLRNLDKESMTAKNLITKAKEALAAEAQKAVDRVKNSIKVIQ
ncbi:MAG: hypothetical protein PHI86_02020 [Candidatus Omnitrophica bacterium]|nr:hypothetical protein [Candidatus Omnitrophota bacterium]HOX53969.1 hypothetical protein [Candidatus Omnitrophota bacterium]